MQSAAKAYGAVAQQTASPRDLEAQLLLRAASRLQNVHDHWDSERAALDQNGAVAACAQHIQQPQSGNAAANDGHVHADAVARTHGYLIE